ncbi:site-specific integrase [Herbaspirillum sp. RTI4]|uniref:site-specific integrase n=1 Tax=Herbaspirillum sp. RTI4 TaxID=3048640 RepID=UPI002AB3776D|nr:site-specific integrase [Herbaspirillum sp. RTI4]MDY7579317.1 site-specific integrase [Herbaspirillum sp. RTI4]MEA9980231.1 site-specific integrase [Herbaspirillum sp. RTI4]
MAYINQRGAFWRAEVRRKGYKPIYRTFDSRGEAQKWARLIESEMDSGLFVDRTEAESTLLSAALERYKREIVPTKRHPYQENRRIDRWLKNDLAYRTLANLRGADFARYRDERRNDGRAENTIRLELQIISHLYEIARKEWGMEGLINPLDNIRKPGGSRARDRRLLPGEYELIHSCLSAHSNCFALPAFGLAIETSLRQGTLFKLRWEWIDLPARMIRMPSDARGPENKGVPAVLPMSSRTITILESIHPRDEFGHLANRPTGLILNTTSNAVVCIWKKMLLKLGIENLRWHDLRHEATSLLFERGLHPMEVASITGHKSMQMLKRYTHLKPESLLAKLG